MTTDKVVSDARTAMLRAATAGMKAGASFDQCLALMDMLSASVVTPPVSEPVVGRMPTAA